MSNDEMRALRLVIDLFLANALAPAVLLCPSTPRADQLASALLDALQSFAGTGGSAGAAGTGGATGDAETGGGARAERIGIIRGVNVNEVARGARSHQPTPLRGTFSPHRPRP